MVKNILRHWLLAIVDWCMDMAQSRSVLVVVIVNANDARYSVLLFPKTIDKNKPLASSVASEIGWTLEPIDRETRFSGHLPKDSPDS